MGDHDEVADLEREGWAALTTDGAAARRFYGEVLVDTPRFLLPGGLVIDDRDAIVASMGGPPWDEHTLHDVEVVPLGGDAAVVTYRAEAARGGEPYVALVSSAYVREGSRWRLAVHQQTPA